MAKNENGKNEQMAKNEASETQLVAKKQSKKEEVKSGKVKVKSLVHMTTYCGVHMMPGQHYEIDAVEHERLKKDGRKLIEDAKE